MKKLLMLAVLAVILVSVASVAYAGRLPLPIPPEEPPGETIVKPDRCTDLITTYGYEFACQFLPECCQ